MACKSCKHFKKIRGHHFGECSNDDFFQYAENKDDLTDLGDNTLVIMGGGEPIVGTEYECPQYLSRREPSNKVLTPTNDFREGSSFKPPAQQKRRGAGRLAGGRH